MKKLAETEKKTVDLWAVGDFTLAKVVFEDGMIEFLSEWFKCLNFSEKQKYFCENLYKFKIKSAYACNHEIRFLDLLPLILVSTIQTLIVILKKER